MHVLFGSTEADNRKTYLTDERPTRCCLYNTADKRSLIQPDSSISLALSTLLQLSVPAVMTTSAVVINLLLSPPDIHRCVCAVSQHPRSAENTCTVWLCSWAVGLQTTAADLQLHITAVSVNQSLSSPGTASPPWSSVNLQLYLAAQACAEKTIQIKAALGKIIGLNMCCALFVCSF